MRFFVKTSFNITEHRCPNPSQSTLNQFLCCFAGMFIKYACKYTTAKKKRIQYYIMYLYIVQYTFLNFAISIWPHRITKHKPFPYAFVQAVKRCLLKVRYCCLPSFPHKQPYHVIGRCYNAVQYAPLLLVLMLLNKLFSLNISWYILYFSSSGCLQTMCIRILFLYRFYLIFRACALHLWYRLFVF